jgi:hypothetical protein
MPFNGIVAELVADLMSSRRHQAVRIYTARSCALVLLGICLAAASNGQNIPKTPIGLAWQIKGSWHVDGQKQPVESGDAIIPGALLRPGLESTAHSITILLPDGQRVLYECFLDSDCARGFRIPMLYRKPDPSAVEMLWRIHAALMKEGQGQKSVTVPTRQMPLPRDEDVTVLNEQNLAEVFGLVGALPDGSYRYTLRAIGRVNARPIQKVFEKDKASIALEMPSPGLYDIQITDRLNTPRIDLVIAAVTPGNPDIDASFRDAKALLEDWNREFQGWPIHDFQRAYLEALMLHIDPQVPPVLSARMDRNTRASVVQEPVFVPRPGRLRGDTPVVLRCGTPAAAIHFTVDGSQPLMSSPVYSAPIMVKGTALTIKAFATARGKDQSAVVTGVFIIGD